MNEEEPQLPVRASDIIEQDFFRARDNIINLMESTDQVLQLLVQLSEQSEHPRCFEVLSNLINSKAALSKDLINLSKERKALVDDRRETNGMEALKSFVGSTAELQKFLASEYAKVIEAEDVEAEEKESDD